MVDRVLNIFQAEGYDLCSFKIKSKDTSECTIREQRIVPKSKSIAESDKLGASLLVKHVPNEAYHELSIRSDLPSLNQVRKLTKSMNSEL